MGLVWKLNNYRSRAAMVAWQHTGDLLRAAGWQLSGNAARLQAGYRELAAQHRWVFIVGCNNSGTSILQRIFNQSGQVSTWRYEGQRYTKVLPRAMRRGYERVWMEYADDLRMPAGSVERLAPRLLHDWMTSLDQPVKPIILEKTPANLLRMGWLQEAFPDSYFIGLVRNGYAVAEGIRRKSDKDIGRAARHWALANRVMTAESGEVDRYLEIRYEDFFSPDNTVSRRLAEFTGLDAAAINAAMNRKYRLRTIKGEGEQKLVNLNAASISRLSERDIADIRGQADDMLDHFGYTTDA